MGGIGSQPLASKYTSNMCADTAAHEELVRTSLEEIEESNATLKGLRRLILEGGSQLVFKRWVEIKLKFGRSIKHQQGGDNGKMRKFERHDQIWDYLQQALNITINSGDEDVRFKEVGDVIFYYLFHELRSVVQKRTWPIHEQLFQFCYGWYSSLGAEKSLSQFYKRLGKNSLALEHLIYTKPQLLFTVWGYGLRDELRKHIPYKNLHQILLNTRDTQGATCMFYLTWYREYHAFVDMYSTHTDDLFELLLIHDVNGRTALHANPYNNVRILCNVITLNNQYRLKELLTITDKSDKGVFDTSSRKLFDWLYYQSEQNCYPLFNQPRVLILYNANNRPRAVEEAESIKESILETMSRCILLEKMGTKREVLKRIKETSSHSHTSGLIVCVMSHGRIGTIEDCDQEPISITAIEEVMCSDQLKERPKILIIQCCQLREDRRKNLYPTSTEIRRPRSGPNYPYEPVAGDFFSVQSSVSGQPSVRNVFIPYLAEQISKSSVDHNLMDVIRSVSRKMLEEGNKQIPIVKSTLRAKLCLKKQGPHIGSMQQWISKNDTCSHSRSEPVTTAPDNGKTREANNIQVDKFDTDQHTTRTSKESYSPIQATQKDSNDFRQSPAR